jgi:hypothetical protein
LLCTIVDYQQANILAMNGKRERERERERNRAQYWGLNRP